MYKKFPIVLAFLIIGGGILWLSIKPSISLFGSKIEEEKTEEILEEVVLQEPEEKDEISVFLKRLKEETNINFQGIKESDFNWIIQAEVSESGSVLVSGKVISAQGITDEAQIKIKDFFVNNDFKINEINTSTEVITNVIGYEGKEFICLYSSVANNKEEGLGEDVILYDIEVFCGVPDLKELEKTESEENNSDLFSTLIDIFSQKYEKPKEEINLTISKNTGIYASGGISFSGEISGAMWLAFKGDSGWKLIFDGNGTIPCESVLPYSFPTDMVSECWDEDLGKLIKL